MFFTYVFHFCFHLRFHSYPLERFFLVCLIRFNTRMCWTAPSFHLSILCPLERVFVVCLTHPSTRIYCAEPSIYHCCAPSYQLFDSPSTSSSSLRRFCQSYFNSDHPSAPYPTRVSARESIATMSGGRRKRKIAATSSDDEDFSVADVTHQVDTSRAIRAVRASTRTQTKAMT
jgi:hypothetical protein